MKKSVALLLFLLLFLACSPRKNGFINRGYQSFSSYYNTLFNSKDALKTEINNRKKNHKDDFYSSYIPILTYDEQTLGTNVESQTTEIQHQGPNGFGGGPSDNVSPINNNKTSDLQIAEAKALKAIANHSMLFDGRERNKEMFNAHILLAQSRLYQNKPLEALDALNYLFANMKTDKRINLAKIYQGEAYADLQDYFKSNEIFSDLQKGKLKKSERKLLTIYYAQMLVNSGKKEEAVEELNLAYAANKNKVLRSRIAFLRGQVLNNLQKPEEARESFVTAYKNANDFEFEVKAQTEIAKTYNANTDDYEGAKDYLQKISKKGTYASRKNEFFYALGLMANKANKPEEAQTFFKRSLQENQSDPQIRGLTFYEIGKNYFNQDDYISAGAYYDSALAVMTYKPTIDEVTKLSNNIKNITKNYYLVKKNDSILALTKMSEPERLAYFGKYIDQLKAKELIAQNNQKKDSHSEGFEVADFKTNTVFNNSNIGSPISDDPSKSSKGGFYFDNQTAVASGNNSFKSIWGNRDLADNWRYSTRLPSIEDQKNEALGLSSAPDSRRFEPDFYIEKIPTNVKEISQLKMERDTASLGLGIMYNTYFGKTKLATKTLYQLVESNPTEDVKLQALYQIFSMNYETNPAEAEPAKIMILKEFPYTSYAEFVKNPKNSNFTKSTKEVEDLYVQAFSLYKENKFEDSRTIIDQAIKKYPDDVLVPKFALLGAFDAGKTSGKEIMILQLQQIALNYPKTQEGQKAQEMLKYLKSDLTVELKDENGNPIDSPTSNVQNPTPTPTPTPNNAVNNTPNPDLNQQDPKTMPTEVTTPSEEEPKQAPTEGNAPSPTPFKPPKRSN